MIGPHYSCVPSETQIWPLARDDIYLDHIPFPSPELCFQKECVIRGEGEIRGIEVCGLYIVLLGVPGSEIGSTRLQNPCVLGVNWWYWV